MSNPRPFPHRHALVATCVALACTGCASPYVSVSDADIAAHRTEPMDLPTALGLERAYHDAYRDKVIALGNDERNLSNGLITLGGVLAGLAAGHASAGTMGGVAIAGGTGYTLGVFNTDKRRAQVYIAGMKALECADEAVLPWNLSRTTLQDLADRMAALQQGEAAIAAASAALRPLRDAARATAGAEGAVAAADRVVASAGASSNAASGARANARRLLRQRDQMGERLRVTVVKIDKAVLDEIRGTEGSIQSVPGILAGLGTNIQAFTGIGAAPAPAGQQMGGELPSMAAGSRPEAKAVLVQATADLSALAARVDVQTQQLADIVATVDVDVRAGASLADCRVDGPSTTMAVTPSSLSFVGAASNRQVLIPSGGKQGYSAAFVQADHPGLSIDPAAAGVDEIYVSEAASTPAAAATYQILVRDTSGQKLIVPVSVTAGAPAPAPGPAPAPAAGPANPAAARVLALSPLPVKATTVTLVTASPGADGSWTVTYSAAADSGLAAADVEAALAANEGFQKIAGRQSIVHARAASAGGEKGDTMASKAARRAASYGAVSAGLSPADGRALQKALCMAPERIDGVWGMRTQAALIADRERREAAGEKGGPQGLLTADEARALLARTPEQTAAACKH
jgi:hypothetical protein